MSDRTKERPDALILRGPLHNDDSAALALAPVAGNDGNAPNPEMHARVLALLCPVGKRPAAGQMTAAQLARESGITEGYISGYRNWKPGQALKFSAELFERSFDGWLSRKAETREVERMTSRLFETPVSRAVSAFVAEVEALQSVGVVTGDAGAGKSCGLRLFKQRHPRALVVTAGEWIVTGRQVADALFKAMGLRGSSLAHNRGMEQVANHLKQSPRTIIVDNAHQLKPTAYRLLFNLNDLNEDNPERPQIPVVLCGNPEIADRLGSNDQFQSRVSRVLNVNDTLKRSEGVTSFVEGLISLYLPAGEGNAALTTAAVQLAKRNGGGRFRKVRKVLDLTARLLGTEAFRDKPAEEAFQKAEVVLRNIRGEEA